MINYVWGFSIILCLIVLVNPNQHNKFIKICWVAGTLCIAAQINMILILFGATL